jgi:hypothetical protein
MSLLATLRKRQSERVATATPATFATQEGESRRTVASVATVAVANPPEAQTASVWWRLHYPDREPAEVASFPPASHAEILERHPEAIAAEPFDQAEPKRACSTCAHRPPGWLAIEVAPCGSPVAAGLSDLPGVIRYSPDQGATCPAWLATLDGELERRILAMAERWGYSGDELALALDAARQDPDGWRRVVDSDEREQ